jgi:zinc protease
MKTHSIKIFSIGIFLFSILQPSINAIAQEKINLADKIPQSKQFIKSTLPNGLTYYIQKNAKPEKTVELRLVVKVGSILEDQDQLGLAHFTEHMAFNGSTHFKKNELVSFLESIGVKFGADLNASTGFDRTIYMIPVSTNKPDNVEKAFVVLSDWASGLTFDHAEIDKERGVVLEESRLRKGASGRMSKIILPKILAGSLYADRLPIGTDENLKTFKYDSLKRFYQDWYRPNLMAVIVVGDIEPTQAEELIYKNFAHLKNPVNERGLFDPLIPQLKANDSLVVTDSEATNSSISIFKGRHLEKNNGTYGDYRQNLIQGFFNRMMGSRLSELTQVANPPFIGASSGMGGLVGDYEQLSSSVAIGKAGVKIAIDALVSENKRAGEFGFSKAELDRAKVASLKSMEVSYKERDKTNSSSKVNEFIRNFTSNESLPSMEDEYQFHQKLIADIMLEEVNQYAKAVLLNDQAQLVIYQGPEKAEHATPEQAELMAMVQAAAKKEVVAIEEKKLSIDLIKQRPAAGKIVSESKNEKLGTTELVLSNGVKVILKNTDFQNDSISVRAIRRGGISLLPDADIGNARYVVQVINSMGLSDFSPSDLRKMLTGKTSSASIQLSENLEGFSGKSNMEDFETLLQIMYLSATAPRRDDALYASFVNRSKDVIKNMLAQPEMQLAQAIIDASFPEHPRKPKIPTEKDFDQLNLDRILAIYKERFFSAKEFNFFVVGSFDAEKMKPLLATYLGSLPNIAVTLGIKDHGLRPVSGIVKKEVYAGKEQKSIVDINLHGLAIYSKEESLKMSAMLEVMQFRITETLREDLGAVYSPRVSGGLTRIPYGAFNVGLNLPCAPENVDKLISSTFAVITKMKETPPLEEDLNKVKTNWIKNNQKNIKTNTYWLSYLSNAQLNGENSEDIFTQEERINAITVQDIQEAANKYLDTKNYIQVVLYPEKKL